MRNKYNKPVLPTVEQIQEYNHEDEACDKRFVRFLQLLRDGTSAGTVEIARTLGVSRMTVYTWAALVRENHPHMNRGRVRKYRGQASVAVSVRIPCTAAKSILAQIGQVGTAQEKTVLRQVCERILVREFGLQAQGATIYPSIGGKA